MVRRFIAHAAAPLYISTAASAALGFIHHPLHYFHSSGARPFINSANPTFVHSSCCYCTFSTQLKSTTTLHTAIHQNDTTIYTVASSNDSANIHCEARLDQIQHDEFLIRLDAKITTADELLISHEESTIIDEIVSVFHVPLLKYLAVEQSAYREELLDGRLHNATLQYTRDISLKTQLLQEDISSASQCTNHIKRQLSEIGIIPSEDYSSDNHLGIHLDDYIPFLNGYIVRHCGTDRGHKALQVQKMLCQRRVPYDFSAAAESAGDNNNTPVISLQKQVIPSSSVNEAMSIIRVIKSRQLLSMNPDSVDGLPSLHLNLISDGKPLFTSTSFETSSSSSAAATETNEEDDAPSSSFAQLVSQLTAILHPYLYNNLLPSVQTLLQSSTVVISDVFIRSYGHDDDDDNDDDVTSDNHHSQQPTRYTLSPHYDITAFATCVITLDSTASTGRNGLYTIPPSKKRNGVTSRSTNNAALRKFFPLNEGDGVVHTYNVLHGVDVDPELQKSRTSLIIWFGNNNNSSSNENDDTDQLSWLSQRTDDISQFVLGLILEEDDISQEALGMYLSSAGMGNIFAITALAQLCSDGKVSNSEYARIKSLIPPNAFHPKQDTKSSCKELANALWYHAAIDGGNPVAQYGLGCSLMSDYASTEAELSREEQEHILLLASVLFTMAYNNHHQDSFEALNRMMRTECQRLDEFGIEIPSVDFFASPVVQVLRLSLDEECDDEIV